MVTETIRCVHCSSEDVIKFGSTRKGTRRFRCHACKRTFCTHPAPKGLTAEKEALILAAYQERCSMRGGARIFRTSRTTVAKVVKKTRFPRTALDHSCPCGAGGDPGTRRTLVVRPLSKEPTMGLDSPVPPYPTGGGLRSGRPLGSHLPETMGEHPARVPAEFGLHGLVEGVFSGGSRRPPLSGREE
jgi:transposase-like protein